MKYREIIPNLSATEEWKEIKLNIGASHSTLQDIKVQKQASGFCYRNDEFIRNRFIYWRTSDDILELSENSLDVNLRHKNLRVTFEESPILSVYINESEDNVTILVVTISNIHRLQFVHPRRTIGANGEQNENSIFSSVTQESVKDPTSFFTISNLLAQNVPHCASCYLSPTSEEAYFAVAHTNHLLLFQMNCFNGHTGVTELKNFQMLPRLFTNLTDVLRGKSNVSDNKFVTSIVFDTIGGENVLYALYRDNNIRMWSTRTGQCLFTLNIFNDNEERRSQGSEKGLEVPAWKVFNFFLFSSSKQHFEEVDGIAGAVRVPLVHIQLGVPAVSADVGRRQQLHHRAHKSHQRAAVRPGGLRADSQLSAGRGGTRC